MAQFKPLLLILTVGVMGSSVFITNGFESHYDSNVVMAGKEVQNRNPYKCLLNDTAAVGFKPCYIGNKDNIKAIVVGDSHADALTTSVANAFDLNKEGVIAITRAYCPFVLGVKNKKVVQDNCYDSNPLVLDFIQNEYKGVPVFVVARIGMYLYGESNPNRVRGDNSPSIYFDKPYYEVSDKLFDEFYVNYKSTICRLGETNQVYITKPIPEMGFNVPKTLSRKLLANKGDSSLDDLNLDRKLYVERNQNIIDMIDDTSSTCGSISLDPSELLCDCIECIASLNGRPIYYDGDHLSEYGNKILTPIFKSALNLNNEEVMLSKLP